jgi:hypothetical protein
VVITTTVFHGQALFEAEALGAHSLRIVTVPHPFGSPSVEAAEQLGSATAAAVWEALRTDAPPIPAAARA